MKDTYLTMIRNSVGSNLFRTLYADIDGKKEDILRDGDLSCSSFVSSILYHFRLLKDVHATVEGTLRDLNASGWVKSDTPIPGAVLLWEEAVQARGELHPHLGFAIADDQAISNSSSEGVPQQHHITFGKKDDGSPVRNIVAIYTHSFLS